MTKILKTIKHVRSPMGKIIKWLFIGFNLLMAFWVLSYWSDVAPMIASGSSSVQAGAAVGSTIGTAMILIIWILGVVILGVPTLLTKGKIVEIEEKLDVSSLSDNLSHSNTIFGLEVKEKFELFVRYLAFLLSCFVGLLLLAVGYFVVGTILIGVGLILLPQIKSLIANKKLEKSSKSILITVGVLAIAMIFLGILIDNSSKQNETPAQNTNVESLNEEARKAFKNNPQKVLENLREYKKDKNWELLKSKTELLLDTKNLEIKNMYDESIVQINEQEKTRKQDEQRIAQEQAAAAAAALWSYSQNDDPMSKGKSYYASISSSNNVEFEFPYAGAQKATLTLRTDPRHGKDIFLSIEKGQILCSSYDGCLVQVRFDDENATSYSAIGPADNSSTVIFIQNYGRFIEKMMNSKRVRISMNVYQEGSPVFEFDVSGFKVDKYKPQGK